MIRKKVFIRCAKTNLSSVQVHLPPFKGATRAQGDNLFVLVLPDQFARSQLLIIVIVLPEAPRGLVALYLEACCFIQNAHVTHILPRSELFLYLAKQGSLVVSQELGRDRGVKRFLFSVFLDSKIRWLRELLELWHYAVERAEIIDAISLKRGNQGSLVLLEKDLGEELAEAFDINHVD